MSSINLLILFASICLISICAAFDSSEIRMIEADYEKRNPLNRMFNDYYSETQKRGGLHDPLIRFGKRSADVEREIRNAMNPLIRFGKRAVPDSAPLIRFGRASLDSAPLIRFGRANFDSAPLIRFGKRVMDSAPLIRFGKRPNSAPLIRFGKRSSAFSAPHIRFGKRMSEDSLYTRFSRNRPSPIDQDVMLRFGRSTPATMAEDEEK